MCVPDNSPVKTSGESFTFILISMKEQEGYYIFPQIQGTFVVMSRWLNLIFVIPPAGARLGVRTPPGLPDSVAKGGSAHLSFHRDPRSKKEQAPLSWPCREGLGTFSLNVKVPRRKGVAELVGKHNSKYFSLFVFVFFLWYFYLFNLFLTNI